MSQHADPLRRIRELCDRLLGAADASFCIRDHAEELWQRADDLSQSATVERSAMPPPRQPESHEPISAEVAAWRPLCPACRSRLEYDAVRTQRLTVLSGEPKQDDGLFTCLRHGVFRFVQKEWLPEDRGPGRSD